MQGSYYSSMEAENPEKKYVSRALTADNAALADPDS
jgi:hypothetical protein